MPGEQMDWWLQPPAPVRRQTRIVPIQTFEISGPMAPNLASLVTTDTSQVLRDEFVADSGYLALGRYRY